MKKCNKCNISKTLCSFSKNKSGKFGVHSICKQCRKQKYKKYGHIERQKRKDKYTKNPTAFLEANKLWYENNKIEARKKKREYYSKNTESFKMRAAKRRIAKLNGTIFDFDHEIKQIYKKAKELELKDGIKREVHHVIPLQQLDNISGLHVPWNLQILTKEEHLKAHKELKRK